MKHSAHRVKIWWKRSRIFGMIVTGRHPRTAVGEHLDVTGQKCSLNEAKILDTEDQVSRRSIKVAIRIHHGRPGLNTDTGLDIPAVMLQLVSHDPEGSCNTSWRMTPGMSRPVSLFSSGFPWCILMTSLILLLDTWSSLSNILASFRLHLWPISSKCSPTAVLG